MRFRVESKGTVTMISYDILLFPEPSTSRSTTPGDRPRNVTPSTWVSNTINKIHLAFKNPLPRIWGPKTAERARTNDFGQENCGAMKVGWFRKCPEKERFACTRPSSSLPTPFLTTVGVAAWGLTQMPQKIGSNGRHNLSEPAVDGRQIRPAQRKKRNREGRTHANQESRTRFPAKCHHVLVPSARSRVGAPDPTIILPE